MKTFLHESRITEFPPHFVNSKNSLFLRQDNNEFHRVGDTVYCTN